MASIKLKLEKGQNTPISLFSISGSYIQFNGSLHTIFQNIVLEMHGTKYLERCEPAISTLNEKKQLRFHDFRTGYIHDSKYWEIHQHGSELFLYEEVKEFADLFKSKFEETTGFAIQVKVIKNTRMYKTAKPRSIKLN